MQNQNQNPPSNATVIDMQNPSGDAQAAGQQDVITSTLKQSSHPTVLIFHIFFRLSAMLVYLIGTFFTSSFILIFVIVILLLSFDFWTVKNVSGRKLVGLRWWNEVSDDGSSKWIYESKGVSLMRDVRIQMSCTIAEYAN